MPENLGLDDVKAILDSGKFDKLIGAVENEQLECKTAPYQLQHNYQKQELAKDVSGLANANGGLILIGVKTERNPTHFGDEIKKVHPFPQTLINPEQYQDILRSWTYPRLQQVDVRWFPSAADRKIGIAAILIPNQTSARRPFLVRRTVDDKGKVTEIVFGYFERKRANVEPMSVEELHRLVKDGLRSELMEKYLENIQDTVLQLQAQPAPRIQPPPQPHISELLRERIQQALTEAALQIRPAFILTAIPTKPLEISTLFEARDANIVRLLEQPPELRHNGFDLNTGAPARIVRGQLRRAVTPGYKSLDLWRDGTLIFVAKGNGDFLSWGRYIREGQPLRINQLVLIESTYLFAELSRQVFNQVWSQLEQIEYRLELRNMTVGGTPCGLIPGALGTTAWRFGDNIHPAPDSTRVFQVPWKEAEINPGAVAFLLVREVYGWFGIEYDQIPYADQIGGRSVISPDQIRRAGK